MELRSIGVYLCIGTFILCTVTTSGYIPKGFAESKCNSTAAECPLGVTHCELIKCECLHDADSSQCDDTPCDDGLTCTLQWLKSSSCCDFVPNEFYFNTIWHVLHIETYVDHVDPSTTFVKTTVWSTHRKNPAEWKLLRINLINVNNGSSVVIPSTLSISNSLDYTGIDTESKRKTIIDRIIETVPSGTSLYHGLLELEPDSEMCYKELDCQMGVNISCDCFQCETVSFSSFSVTGTHNYMNATDGWYILEVGNGMVGSIGKSSELSPLHSTDNSINEWKEGSFGGWAPAANDSNTFMSFHGLSANVCGIAIQGMAGSTFRSLDQFTVQVGGVNLTDDMDKTIIYTSGVLLHSTSAHFFQKPVDDDCLQINVLKPEDPTRVGFRAGLITCASDSQIPLCQFPKVCAVVDDIVQGFEELDKGGEQYAAIQTDPAAAAVFIASVINNIISSLADVEEPFTTKLTLGNTEVNIVGETDDVLKDEGFTYTPPSPHSSNGDDSPSDEPPLRVTIPTTAFKDFPENKTIVIVVSVTTPNASAVGNNNITAVEIDTGDDDGDDKFAVGSSIIQISTYVDGIYYELPSFEYDAPYKNITLNQEAHCAYFQEQNLTWNDTVRWKFEGCRNDEKQNQKFYALCVCSHTTSFSVLVKISKDDHGDTADKISSIVTYVGLAISITSLVAALLIYFVLRSTVSSARYAIHSNLMIALLLLDITFLLLLNKKSLPALCRITMYLMQYLFLACFCWMLAEGVHLYRQIITVFESERKQTWIYFAIGWGIPLIFVAAAIGVTVENEIISEVCFFSYEDNSIWFVVIPILIIILANLCILIRVTLVVVKAVKFQAEKGSSEKVKQVKAGVRSALLLMPLLGSTHILLFFVGSSAALRVLYDLLNSLQGFFVALVYCAMNSEVRNAISQHIRRSKDASAIHGSTTGLRDDKSGKSKSMFSKKNKVGATQFTFTSGSQSKLGSDVNLQS